MRIFIDTSVFVSACASQIGGSHYLFAIACIDPRLQLVTNSYALIEARRNVEKKLPQASDRLAELTTAKEVIVAQEPPIALIELAATVINAKDAPILAGALFARADILCSLDKKDFHTSTLKKWCSQFDISIFYPGDAIRAWRKNNE